MTATVPALTIYRAVGAGERSAVDIREHLRDAPDLAGLTAELDDLARHGRLRSRDPGHGRPTLYSLVVPLILPGGVDRTARLIDLDRRRLETAALTAVAGVLSRAGTHARSAYRMGRDPGADVVTTLAGGGNVTGIGPRLARVATAANYAGRQRTAKQAQAAGADRSVLAGLLTMDGTAEAVATARYEQQVQGYVNGLSGRAASAVRLAASGPTAEQAIGAALATAGVAGRTNANPAGPWSVRMLAAFLIGLAYADGQDVVLLHPAVASLMTALTYVTRDDGRVRPFHAELHGMTRPPSDPVWRRVTPPRWSHEGVPQYGCRCWRVPRFGAVQLTGVPAGV